MLTGCGSGSLSTFVAKWRSLSMVGVILEKGQLSVAGNPV